MYINNSKNNVCSICSEPSTLTNPCSCNKSTKWRDIVEAPPSTITSTLSEGTSPSGLEELYNELGKLEWTDKTIEDVRQYIKGKL